MAALIPVWLDLTKQADISLNLGVDAALREAAALRDAIRQGTVHPHEVGLSSESVEILHALCQLLEHDETATQDQLLQDCEAAFRFVDTISWPKDAFGGRADIRSRLAFLCWRNARRSGDAANEWRWGRAHELASISAAASNAASVLLETTTSSRASKTIGSYLEDPEVLLCAAERLKDLAETSPTPVREAATALYAALAETRREIDTFSEREFYLSEFALIAGTACRLLGLRKESWQWFDIAELYFVNGKTVIGCGRLAYQRLALRIEERQFESVLPLVQQEISEFIRLGLPEEALKCRFLEAIILKETNRLDEAEAALQQILIDSVKAKNDRLAAVALQNLFQLYAFRGQTEEAVRVAEELLPVLRRLDSRVGLAKLQLGLGYLLRSQGRPRDAIEAYRKAQLEFRELGMVGDMTTTHLVLAALLLDEGQASEAEREICAALPIIEGEKMVSEGMAALSLLRDSMRRRQIDRQALRSLNRYFEVLGGS